MIPKKLLLLEGLNRISLQQAIDGHLFGPVYHGTLQKNREKIAMDGFNIPVGNEKSGDIANGYEISDYYGGIPAPIHHLGFGVYFTTSMTIAKRFSGGTGAGIKPFFLDVPRIETINWGSPRTMMKWWSENGYDYKRTPETAFGGSRTEWGSIREERLRATKNMTEYLSSRYDAVWYKGKGMYKLLDGDQVCVYDPDNIYLMDKSLIQPGEIGSVVVAKVGIDLYGRGKIEIPMGTKGIITGKIDAKKAIEAYPHHWAANAGADYFYNVKWKPGGNMPQVPDKWIEPYVKK